MPDLTQWDSFYVIVGSAAGALIGLQFVVMTLMADSPSLPNPVAGAAFGSPTIVHFSVALFLSAIVRVPWPRIGVFAFVLGAMGLLGVIYIVIVARRMTSQNAYRPDLEDWTFHAVIPGLAYALLLAAGLEEPIHVHGAMFGAGAAALLLLFDGIHNSWDAVAYRVYVIGRNRQQPPE
jgi:uncharacterized membrane protein YdcZ (DUF606 family)